MYEITIQVIDDETEVRGEIVVRDGYFECLEALSKIHMGDKFYLISATLVRVEGI